MPKIQFSVHILESNCCSLNCWLHCRSCARAITIILARAIREDKVSILTHCLMTVNTTGKHLEACELFSMQT